MNNQFFKVFVTAIMIALPMVAMQPASAVSVFETDATSDTFSGGVQSDPQGPATTGSLFSEVLVPTDIAFSGDGFSRAAADDTGSGAAGVNGIFANGNPALNVLTANSTLDSSLTNTTGSLLPFSYDFFLPGPRLTLADFAGLADTDSPTITAFFDFRVSLDFGSGFVPYVASQGELTGGIDGHSLGTAGTDPLASTFFTDITYPNNIFGYQFDDFSGSVNASLGAGESVVARTSLFVSISTPGFESGAAASIGDPLDLSAGAFSGAIATVPVPPAAWLFGSGLIGLIGIARRKLA